MTARILVIINFESRAKEPEANAAGLQCGFGAMGSIRHVAGRTATTTSENLDVTAGETALIPDYECPKIAELRRQSKMLREHFKPKTRMP